MSDQAMAELATHQHGLFARSQALAAGVTPRVMERRIRSGRWLQVTPGVYSLPGFAPTWRRELMAACLEAGPGAVASHEAAAALHRLDSFPPGRVVVTVTHGDHQHLRLGRLRQSTDLRAHHRTVVDGIPVTSVARTFADLAAHAHPVRLRNALDSALTSGRCSLDDVSRCHDELCRPGKRGMCQLRLLLAARGEGWVPAATTLERRLSGCSFRAVSRRPSGTTSCRGPGHPWPRRLRLPGAAGRREADSRRWHTRERDFEAPTANGIARRSSPGGTLPLHVGRPAAATG